MEERWRAIDGWPHHEVSDHGRVRSLDHVVPTGLKSSSTRLIKGKIMRATVRPRGYRVVGGRYVHQLVLKAFVGPRPDGYAACHNDGNPANNYATNLRWGTYAANVADTIEHGNHHYAARTICKRGHNLVEPNLDRYQLKHGHRLCRACKNGHEVLRKSTKLTLQEAADQAYVKIMADA